MLRKLLSVSIFIAISIPSLAFADELAQMIQQDLVTLGYDPGATDGEMSTKTIVAISKFQAEHNLEVTGEATPQLAGIIKASINQQNNPAMSANSVAAPAALSAQDLQAAQQACLQQKYAEAQASQKKKRGFGSLMRAVTRTATQLGSSASSQIYETSRDVYDVNATAADLESAAKDLGLTEDDIEACRNPN